MLRPFAFRAHTHSKAGYPNYTLGAYRMGVIRRREWQRQVQVRRRHATAVCFPAFCQFAHSQVCPERVFRDHVISRQNANASIRVWRAVIEGSEEWPAWPGCPQRRSMHDAILCTLDGLRGPVRLARLRHAGAWERSLRTTAAWRRASCELSLI